MPYDFFTKKREGKEVYCMTSKRTGKTYCYKSKADRKEGMRLHEAYSHGFKMTNKK